MGDLDRIIDWYKETSPTCADIEHELKHHNIDMSLYEFIEYIERFNK